VYIIKDSHIENLKNRKLAGIEIYA